MFKQILLVILFDRDLENPHQCIFMNFMLCVCVVTSVESEVWAHTFQNIPVEVIGQFSAVSPFLSHLRQHFISQASCLLSCQTLPCLYLPSSPGGMLEFQTPNFRLSYLWPKHFYPLSHLPQLLFVCLDSSVLQSFYFIISLHPQYFQNNRERVRNWQESMTVLTCLPQRNVGPAVGSERVPSAASVTWDSAFHSGQLWFPLASVGSPRCFSYPHSCDAPSLLN